MTRSFVIAAALHSAVTCGVAEELSVGRQYESLCTAARSAKERRHAATKLTSENSLIQVHSRRLASAQPTCSLQCIHKNESHSCKARTLWVFGQDVSASADSGNITRSIEDINDECSGQCACSADDFPELLDSPCSSICTLGDETYTCRDRVLWSLHASDSLVMPEALELVNNECVGQCSCAQADFPILPQQPPELPCHTAVEGDECFASIEWVLTEGLHIYPGAYGDLTAGSSNEEAQEFLNKHGKGTCRRPCDVCRTARKGDACYSEVQDAMDALNLSSVSDFENIQDELNRTDSNSTCTRPCWSCRSVESEELCHHGVVWAMHTGIFENPESFEGLSSNSSFKDFQAFMHRANLHRCPLPCDALEA